MYSEGFQMIAPNRFDANGDESKTTTSHDYDHLSPDTGDVWLMLV
jgi:hypothetical protein